MTKEEYFQNPKHPNEDITLQPVEGKEPGSISALSIGRLSETSPIYAAGFRRGDRILKVNDKPVTSMARALNLSHEIQMSATLLIQVERKGDILDYQFDFD